MTSFWPIGVLLSLVYSLLSFKALNFHWLHLKFKRGWKKEASNWSYKQKVAKKSIGSTSILVHLSKSFSLNTAVKLCALYLLESKCFFLSLFGFQPGHLVSFSFIIITIIFKKKGVTNRPFRTPKLLLGVRRWSLLKLSVEPSWTRLYLGSKWATYPSVWYGSDRSLSLSLASAQSVGS